MCALIIFRKYKFWYTKAARFAHILVASTADASTMCPAKAINRGPQISFPCKKTVLSSPKTKNASQNICKLPLARACAHLLRQVRNSSSPPDLSDLDKSYQIKSIFFKKDFKIKKKKPKKKKVNDNTALPATRILFFLTNHRCHFRQVSPCPIQPTLPFPCF